MVVDNDDSAPVHGELGAKLLLALSGSDAWEERRRLLESPERDGVFLRYVAETIPYYQSAFGRGRLRAGLTLADFPMISRSELAAKRNSFVSSSAIRSGNRFFAKTSGSTGFPLTVYFDLASWYDLNHETFATVASYVPGLRRCMRPGRLGVALLSNETWRRQNFQLILPLKCALWRKCVLGRNADDDLALVRRLRDAPVPLLYGKPAYLEKLAELDAIERSNGSRIRPKAILVSGENLFEDARERLENWFGAKVYNAYTSVEGGLVALQCAHGRGLHVQTSRVRLEIRRPGGRIADNGAGEIVLTNFSNWAMPIVRYRTGDNATLGRDKCACGFEGQTIFDLPAREAGRFELPHRSVSTRSLDKILLAPAVKEFSFERTEMSRFAVRWVARSRDVDAKRTGNSLQSRLRKILGDVAIDVSCVDGIVKPGGKLRRYVDRVAAPEPDVIRRWDRAVGARVALIGARTVRSLAFLPDATRCAIAASPLNGAGAVQIFDYASKTHVATIGGHRGDIYAIAFSADGALAVTAGADAIVRIWRTDKLREKCRLLGHGGPIAAVAVSPDGRLVASAGRDRTVRLWNLRTGAKRVEFRFTRGIVSSVAFSPDGNTVAAAGGQPRGPGGIVLWDLATGEKRREFASGSFVSSIGFVPDEETLIAGDWSANLTIWDIASGWRLGTLEGHRRAIHSVAFSPEAKVVASGGADGSVRLWHLWTGRQIADLRGHACAVSAVGFSPGGETLASASRDGEVRLWSIADANSPD